MTEVNYIRTQAMPKGYIYTIRIDRPITDADEFQEELATLRQASAADDVHILINSGGGSAVTMKAFLNVMSQSEAHIITEIEGECCSAATMIFLAGHEFRVSDDAEFMIHTAGYGTYGKAMNVKQQVDFEDRSIKRLLRKYYRGFLSPEEIELALEGKDFWMDADEIIERLQNRQEEFEKEQEEAEQADLAEQLSQLEEMMGIQDIPSEGELKKMTKAQLIEYILGNDEEPEEE